MNRAETAVQKFRDGYNCAQSVLFSLMDYTGLSEDFSLRIATGFGSGMGRTQNVCGAVSGGILALNILYGRGAEDGKEQQEEVYSKIRELIKGFESKNGTIICRQLLDGCDLMTDEGQLRFGSENMAEICYGCIASAAEIVEGLIKEH